MTGNGAGPAATAIADEARKLGQLAGSTASENNAGADQTQANRANGADRLYVASDIKRFRRTKRAITSIKDAIIAILEKDNPQTVRQVFYALTVRGAIKKEEIEYQRTVVRLLGELREAGTIPFEWIADNTRWQRKPTTFTGIEACLDATAKHYRRDLWAAISVYVEVWCEKDALAGVLMEETEPYDVPLMVAKGYASLSFLHSAAMMIRAKEKPAHIYHFGDLDPSGRDAARDIETKLRRYAPGAEIHFECPAVTREQVEQWNLPTRPTKKTDTRAKKFGSDTSVELDAIPAVRLRELVRDCIGRHIDPHKLTLTRVAEESERNLLTNWAATYAGRP